MCLLNLGLCQLGVVQKCLMLPQVRNHKLKYLSLVIVVLKWFIFVINYPNLMLVVDVAGHGFQLV